MLELLKYLKDQLGVFLNIKNKNEVSKKQKKPRILSENYQRLTLFKFKISLKYMINDLQI